MKPYKQLSVKAFKETYKIDYTNQSISYHMRKGKIDFVKPSRDSFIVLSPKTLKFYNIVEC